MKSEDLKRLADMAKSRSERLHLTSREVDRLLHATKGSRHEARDRCLLLVTFRHGLRVSEACQLTIAQVDADSRVLHVHRLKNGLSTDHPLRADELRAIAGWLKVRGQTGPARQECLFRTSRYRVVICSANSHSQLLGLRHS